MNLGVRILLGAVAGWLAGKIADGEGISKLPSAGSVQARDAIYGITGALFGDSLFFWIVIGRGNAFSDFATAALGAVTVSGAARLIGSRIHRSRQRVL